MRQMTKQEKSHGKRIGPLKDQNNKLVYDDLKKSIAMNSFFATVGEKLASSFLSTSVNMMPYISRVTPSLSDIALSLL